MMKKVNKVTQANKLTIRDLRKQNKDIKSIKKRIENNLRMLNSSFAFMQYNQIINEIDCSYSKFKLRNTSYICNSYIIVILNDINEIIEKAIINFKMDSHIKETLARNISSLKKVLYIRNNSTNTSSNTIEQQLLEMIKNKIREYEEEIEQLEAYIKENESPLDSRTIENHKIKEQIEHIKQKIENMKTTIC